MFKGMLASSKPFSPLGDRTYRRLFTAQVIALIGTGLPRSLFLSSPRTSPVARPARSSASRSPWEMVAYVLVSPLIAGIAHAGAIALAPRL